MATTINTTAKDNAGGGKTNKAFEKDNNDNKG